MKKSAIVLAAGVLAAVLGMSSCATTTVALNCGNGILTGTEYKILGRVKVEVKASEGEVYNRLLNYAQVIYPSADSVVDVFADVRVDNDGKQRKYVLSGIAIDYEPDPAYYEELARQEEAKRQAEAEAKRLAELQELEAQLKASEIQNRVDELLDSAE